MIDLILVALLQAAAGDPSTPPAPEAPAAQVEVAAQPAASTNQTTWVCRVEQRTGSRLDRRRICRRAEDEENLRDRLGDDLRDRAAVLAVQPTP